METSIKVLFVSSGNSSNFEISPFIKAQGESLRKQGIEITYFQILGKGFRGYLKSSKLLRKYLVEHKVDIIHAHYVLCGWTALLSRSHLPIVLSLMGSDVFGDFKRIKNVVFKRRYLTILTFFIQPFVKSIIVKSKNIEKYVYHKNICHLIPNGVSFEEFKQYNLDIKKDLGLLKNYKYVLFLGDKQSINKNFTLLDKSLKLLDKCNLTLLTPYPIEHSLVPRYLNAVDVVVLTSFMEGSPNIIKEAMACNCPIVATDVGDIKWVIGNTDGCYITTFEPEDLACKLKLALDFGKRTQGRKHLIELKLGSDQIAKRIRRLYQRIIAEKKEPAFDNNLVKFKNLRN